MTTPDLDNLIARLEKATGPDRELDSLIARSLEKFPTIPFKGDAPFERLAGMYWVVGTKDTPNGPVEEKWSKNPPPYTASLDAALTLVPKDFFLRKLAQFEDGWHCTIIRGAKSFDAKAKTGSGAISAAALKARTAAGKPSP